MYIVCVWKEMKKKQVQAYWKNNQKYRDWLCEMFSIS